MLHKQVCGEWQLLAQAICACTSAAGWPACQDSMAAAALLKDGRTLALVLALCQLRLSPVVLGAMSLMMTSSMGTLPQHTSTASQVPRKAA